MKAVLIDSCRYPRRTDVLHHLLFHGEICRPDRASTDNHAHFQGDNIAQSLRLSKSGLYHPKILKPENSLIVTDEVKNILVSYDGIFALPVLIDKLVDYWAAPGDFSYYDTDSYKRDPYTFRSDGILDRLPHNPALASLSPNYYELVIPNTFSMTTNYHDVKQYEFTVSDKDHESIEFPYAQDSLAQYPIMWAMYVLIRYDIYKLLESFFDHDFYTTTTVDV